MDEGSVARLAKGKENTIPWEELLTRPTLANIVSDKPARSE